jgi:hypothetical protein
MTTRTGRWIIGGIAGTIAGLVVASPALAAPSSTIATFTRAASSHTSPTPASTAIEGFEAGDQIEAICFVNAVYDGGTDVWLRVANGGGWVSRSALDVAPLEHC